MVSTRHSFIKTEELDTDFEAAPLETSFETAQRTSTVPPSHITPPARMDGLSQSEDQQMEDSHGTRDTMEALSARSRDLIQAVRRLEALRIKDALPSNDLPKFIVIGDQSHGKSSIIEAICGISLPRAAGTCTRCPFEITTTAKSGLEGWVCKISLLRRYVLDPKAGPQAKYKGWRESYEQDDVEFHELSEKADLERWVRLAQIAICNPAVPPAQIAEMNDINYPHAIEFSPNIISLEISGPLLPEMSLTDLPGTINVHPDKDKHYLVTFIGKLVKSYIQQDNALVLLAASASGDIETSIAMGYINRFGSPARSMGVLTKPDLSILTVTELHNILSGKTFQLPGGGWYVTKLLSQEDLDNGVMHTEARENEQAFFAGNPWSSELSEFSDRFGVPNLQNMLSEKLTSDIKRRIPHIFAKVKTHHQELLTKLQEFPEQDKDAQRTVTSKISSVTNAIAEQLKCDNTQATFKTTLRDIIERLEEEFKRLRPRISLATPGVKQIITIDDDSEDDSDTVQSTPSKRRKGNNGHRVVPIQQDTPIKKEKDCQPSDSQPPAHRDPTKFTLKEVRAAYSHGYASTMGEFNPQVTTNLTTTTLVGWKAIVDITLSSVSEAVANMSKDVIASQLSEYQRCKLFPKIGASVDRLFEELMKTKRAFIMEYISYEMLKPVTYSLKSLKKVVAAVKKEQEAARQDYRIREFFDAHPDKKPKNAEQDKQLKEKQKAEVIQILGADPYAKEVKATAKILGYYDCASASLPDFVARVLRNGLFIEMQNTLYKRLYDELCASDAARCAELVAEDPVREKERRDLEKEKQKLEDAMAEIDRLCLRAE